MLGLSTDRVMVSEVPGSGSLWGPTLPAHGHALADSDSTCLRMCASKRITSEKEVNLLLATGFQTVPFQGGMVLSFPGPSFGLGYGGKGGPQETYLKVRNVPAPTIPLAGL